jgi:hypothetical protein
MRETAPLQSTSLCRRHCVRARVAAARGDCRGSQFRNEWLGEWDRYETEDGYERVTRVVIDTRERNQIDLKTPGGPLISLQNNETGSILGKCTIFPYETDRIAGNDTLFQQFVNKF